MFITRLSRLSLPAIVLLTGLPLHAQTSLKPKYSNSIIYTGIEVGSKGVKMSVIEIGKNAQSSGAFNILKDTTVNTDFISFSQPTLRPHSTVSAIYFNKPDYQIPPGASSLLSAVAKPRKDGKTTGSIPIDSFRLKIKPDGR
jgi:hypothetical protein